MQPQTSSSVRSSKQTPKPPKPLPPSYPPSEREVGNVPRPPAPLPPPKLPGYVPPPPVPREIATRPPFVRMQRIHEHLRAGRPVNAALVARELETSARTIQRDLDYMRDTLGLPIVYEPERHKFVYSWPVDPAIFGGNPAPVRQEPASDAFGLPLDDEPAGHPAIICERHGVRRLDVVRAIVGDVLADMLADAMRDSSVLHSIVRAARVLAVNGREAA